MKINDIPYSFVFIPEEVSEGETKGFTGNYDTGDPAGTDFRKLCCDLVWLHFTEAWDFLKSFFENTMPESIEFSIDLTPEITNQASVLIYRQRPLRSVQSRIEIRITRLLLEKYLEKHWIKDHELSGSEATTIRHELIHILDKFQEEQFILGEGKSCGKSVILHLMNFRYEGIAELPLVLLPGAPVSDMETAREVFEAELFRILKVCQSHPRDYIKLSSNLECTSITYLLGPWMILHVLSCPGNPDRFDMIDKVLENIKSDKNTDRDIALSLIGKALGISNYSFMKYLTEPGLDGLPFISKREMGVIVNLTGRIGLNKKTEDSFRDMDFRIAQYYSRKIVKLYNSWGRSSK